MRLPHITTVHPRRACRGLSDAELFEVSRRRNLGGTFTPELDAVKVKEFSSRMTKSIYAPARIPNTEVIPRALRRMPRANLKAIQMRFRFSSALVRLLFTVIASVVLVGCGLVVDEKFVRKEILSVPQSSISNFSSLWFTEVEYWFALEIDPSITKSVIANLESRGTRRLNFQQLMHIFEFESELGIVRGDLDGIIPFRRWTDLFFWEIGIDPISGSVLGVILVPDMSGDFMDEPSFY